MINRILISIGIPRALAQLNKMDEVHLPGEGVEIRDRVREILLAVISYVALLALIMVVLAGLYMIFSLGEEANKDKAKKIILYTILGMLLIFFAAGLVGILTNAF